MKFRIIIKLREVIEAYKRRTGERMTYDILAERTGLAKGTFRNIGSRQKSGANLSTIAQICGALDVSPNDLLEVVEDPPKVKSKAKRKTKKK